MPSQQSPSKGKEHPCLLKAGTTLQELPNDEKRLKGVMEFKHKSVEVNTRLINATSRAPTSSDITLKQASLEINKRPLNHSPLLKKTTEEKSKKKSEFWDKHCKKINPDIKKHYLDFEKAFHASSDEMGPNEKFDSEIDQSVSNALSQNFANSNNMHDQEVNGHHPINVTDPTNHTEVDRGVLGADTGSLNNSQLQIQRDELEQEYTDTNQLQVAWLEAVEALSAGKVWKGMNANQKSAYDRAIRFRARSTICYARSFGNRIEKYAARIFIIIKELEAVGISAESADLRNILNKADLAINLPLEECRRIDGRVRMVELPEIECRGPCGKSKTFYHFSKVQRAKETSWCLACVNSEGITNHLERMKRAITKMENTLKPVQEPRKLWAPEVAPKVEGLTMKHTSVLSAHSPGALSSEDISSKNSPPGMQTSRKQAMVSSGCAVNANNTVPIPKLLVTDMEPSDTTPHPKETLDSQADDIITNGPGVKASATHLHHLNANVFQHQSSGMANNKNPDFAETHVGLANSTILNHKYSTQDLEAMKEKELVTENPPMRECRSWEFAIENALPCWNQAGSAGFTTLDGQLYSSITSHATYQQLNNSGFSDKLLRALMMKSLQQQSVTIPLFPNNGEEWRFPRFILNGQLCERRPSAMRPRRAIKKRNPPIPVDRDLDPVSDAKWKTLAESELFSLPLAGLNLGNEQASIENAQKPSTSSHSAIDHYAELEFLQQGSPPEVPAETDSRYTYELRLPHSIYYDAFPNLHTHAPSASLGIEAQNMMCEARKKALISRVLHKASEEQTEEENNKNFNDIGTQDPESSPVAEACGRLEAHQKAIPTEDSPPPRREQNNFDYFSRSRVGDSPFQNQYLEDDFNSRLRGIDSGVNNLDLGYHASSNAHHVDHMSGTYMSTSNLPECMTSSVDFEGLRELQSAFAKRGATDNEKSDGNTVQDQNERVCFRDCVIKTLENRDPAASKRQERESTEDQNSTDIVNNDGAKAELANTEVAAISEAPVPTSPGELDAHTFTLDIAKPDKVPQAQDLEFLIPESSPAQEVYKDEYDSDAESEDSWTMAEDEVDGKFGETVEWEML